MKIKFTATTLLGVESITARECKDLGFLDVSVSDGKVSFFGDFKTLCMANICLRTAERVYINVGEFDAHTFDELFENTKSLPWEEWLPKDAEFPVNAYSLRSALFSVPDCQAIVKKAIVERMKSKYKTEWFAETGAKYKIQLGLLKDRATLMIDTSGEGLHKRGYRETANIAPLKETLASAIILLGYWKDSKAFRDPFCGSGTFPIEAALLGAGIAPGINRKFIAETWGGYDKKLWAECRSDLRSLEKKDVSFDIIGSDIDRRMIKLASENAKLAGVSKLVRFENKGVSDFEVSSDYGVSVCNPPYGERMGEIKEAEQLYTEMGKAFRRYPTWSFYILTPHDGFEKFYGAKASKKRKLYNGMIKCNLCQYIGEKPKKI